jgi:DNA polymerase-3 subunit delta'
MWQGLEGHDRIVAQFRRALARGRLASTFLFVGPPGIGKRSFALALAKSLLCERRDVAMLDPCGMCPSCVQVEAGTHPDIHAVQKPEGKSEIPVALFIGPLENRMREGFCFDISLKPFGGGRKIGIIDDSDFLNEEGANALLKTLEEPPPRSVIILVGTSEARQLPTIRSRAQIIRFAPLSQDTVARLLIEKQVVADFAEASRLAAFSEGSVSRATELSDPDLWRFRGELLAKLAAEPLESFRLAPAVVPFVDAAGKEAPPRRARARQLIGFAIGFYRRLLYRQIAAENTQLLAGDQLAGDDELDRHVFKALKAHSDPEATAARIERSLEALGHIDRNANQATLLEAWLDDLRLARGAALAEV